MRFSARAGFAGIVVFASAHCQAEVFTPPASSAEVFQGISLEGTPVADKYKAAFAECDKTHSGEGMFDSQCGTPNSTRPGPNPNNNTTFIKLANGTIVFDARMSVDADGSPYAIKHKVSPDNPNTTLTYADGRTPLNGEKVRYVVIPGPSRKDPTVTFMKETGTGLGDVAAIVYDGKVTYAIVGDTSPFHRIGEASMAVNDALGHTSCKRMAANGICAQPVNDSVTKDVVYLIFPGTRAELCGGASPSASPSSPNQSSRLCPGVTADNINDRLDTVGEAAFKKLKGAGQAGAGNAAGAAAD
jgi:Fungal chitosanase of glycosyl hydrolase group 75